MKEMGIPMGPRKKLMGYLRNQKQNMVGVLHELIYSIFISRLVCEYHGSFDYCVCYLPKTKSNVIEQHNS